MSCDGPSGRQMNDAVGGDGFQTESVIFRCPDVGFVQLLTSAAPLSFSTPSFEWKGTPEALRRVIMGADTCRHK